MSALRMIAWGMVDWESMPDGANKRNLLRQVQKEARKAGFSVRRAPKDDVFGYIGTDGRRYSGSFILTRRSVELSMGGLKHIAQDILTETFP